MRKYLLDYPSRSIRMFDAALPPLQSVGMAPPSLETAPPPEAVTLTGRLPFDWGPTATISGRIEAAQALLVDALTYYDIERDVTRETLRVGATLASVFARPYADHVLRSVRMAQVLLTAEEILFWLVDQVLQGLEHPERRTAQAVLTYMCNVLLHKEVTHARRELHPYGPHSPRTDARSPVGVPSHPNTPAASADGAPL